METVNNSLNWFEIPVLDFQRARKFYSTLFDFEMPHTFMGKNEMGFFLVQPKHIGGAIVKGDGYIPSPMGTLVYLNAGYLNNVLSQVEKSGGKIVLNKSLIAPELGFYALFIDTEGNKVALHSMK